MTRVFVEGGGGTVLADLLPGETILPMDTVGWYQPGGGTVAAGTQRLTYTGIAGAMEGVGSLIGPGVTPSAPPGVAPTIGTGVDAGTHSWAYTWITPSGETLPSPIAAASTAAEAAPTIPLVAGPPMGSGINAPITAPTTAVSVNNSIPSSPNAGMDFGTYDYVVTFYTYSGETTPGPISNSVTVSDPTHTIVNVQNLPIGPDGTVGRKIYRRLNHAGAFSLVRTQTNNLGAPLGETSFGDAVPNASVGPAAPTANTSGAGAVLNPPAEWLVLTLQGASGPAISTRDNTIIR